MVFISPDQKAGYFWGGYVRGGWLTSHDLVTRPVARVEEAI